jgi:hypothetical protein
MQRYSCLQFAIKGDEIMYPEPKRRELNEVEKARLRERVRTGDADVYQLADDYDRSSSQVAGLKAAMTRRGDARERTRIRNAK